LAQIKIKTKVGDRCTDKVLATHQGTPQNSVIFSRINNDP